MSDKNKITIFITPLGKSDLYDLYMKGTAFTGGYNQTTKEKYCYERKDEPKSKCTCSSSFQSGICQWCHDKWSGK